MMTEDRYVFLGGGKSPIYAWTKGVHVETQALQQARDVADMPFIAHHVALMPDAHWGYGATVGSVIPTKGAIIPSAVGVDIGCGMCAVKINLTASDLPDSLFSVRNAIEAAVPVGFNDFGADVPRASENVWYSKFKNQYNAIQHKYPATATKRSPAQQIGTLGGGNHFIEVCLDEEQNVWVMLHSGSRGVGNRIGQFFIAEAKREMERHFIHLPNKDLAYLIEGSEIFDDYVEAVNWAQEYARINRDVMMANIMAALNAHFRHLSGTHIGGTGRGIAPVEMAINCHHNYVEWENHFNQNCWVTRKGAVRAGEGEFGIIPGSMGVQSYIVVGKGNANSFQSCSHGAGRMMSRTDAKKRFTVADHIVATEGVECRKDEKVLDETPGAYKPIEAVMAAQSDLVNIVHTLKQVVCVKG